jgi:two-component system sensor histidine kinase BaeS
MFLAIAALSIVVLAAFAALQIRSFQQGFLHYVNRLEREKLETASQRLAEAYGRNGSWDFLRGDTRRLLRLLELGAPGPERELDDAPPPRLDRYGRPRPAFGPPPGRRQGMGPAGPQQAPGRPPAPPFGPPPPGRGGWPPPGAEPPPADDGIAPDDAQAPDFAPPPRPRPPQAGANLRPRLLLLDADGGHVAGNPGLARDLPAIDIVHDGEVVGRLLIAPLPRLRSDLDLDFAREQRLRLAAIGSAALLAALLLAWALSRWLLQPVRALAAGTRALASGDYATRIPEARGDELGALAQDFNRLASTLEQHRDARRQWGADIAHELRTPISVLSGEIQALQDGVRQVDAARLASLQAECTRLRDLVEDLYQLSLSDAGALTYRFEAVDLAGIVRESVQAHAGALRDAGLHARIDAVPAHCPLARADGKRLRQLIDNLLANAMRYTDGPGEVAIAIEHVADRCRLRIDDTPPGVPDAALPRLFERLYRVESSRSRRHGGAGLGLAICRNIVEAHGGRIAAAHSPLGGLRIEIELPTDGVRA